MRESNRDRSQRPLLSRPFVLVALGFGIGYAARFLLGPPAEDHHVLPRQFKRPLPVVSPEVDMTLDRVSG